jgi:hypothetical protein
MIDIKHKRCIHDGCTTHPSYNLSTETKALYCKKHKKENMIDIKSKLCQYIKCKNDAIYGIKDKKSQFCFEHKKENMINLYLDNKCNVDNCEKEHEIIIDNIKFCLTHCPDNKIEIILKRKCKYCDIEEDSKYVCNDCKKIQHKKEWSIIRILRKNIDTKFEYDSNKMLNGCSKKRPDVYFELNKHCVIVEIDEYQHKTYEDKCECARLNEIVNGIGGKSVIIIRFNPDKIKNNKTTIDIPQKDRIDLLIKIVKEELTKDYENFVVKIIQLFYDDDYIKYEPIKKEDITDIVCI